MKFRSASRSRRRDTTIRVTAICGLALIVLATSWAAGLVWFTSRIPTPGPLPLGATKAIVVLTGGSDRLAEGLKLLEAGRAEKLFVSGVYRGVDVAALLRVARQAPGDLECCIVLGYAADSTAGNARETASWMRAEGYRSMRLVTASYHMPRSLLEFRRALSDVEIIAHPVFPAQFKHSEWWLWPGTAALIAREYNKYLMARLWLTGIGAGPAE